MKYTFFCLYCQQKLLETSYFASGHLNCDDCNVLYHLNNNREINQIYYASDKYSLAIHLNLNQTTLRRKHPPFHPFQYTDTIIEINKIFWLPPNDLINKLLQLQTFS